MTSFEIREKETELKADPAQMPGDGRIIFIGRISSPWKKREDCPKNLRQARERNQKALILVDEEYRPGLTGIEPGNAIILLSWLDRAPRNLIVQKPKHRDEPTGVFNLRSPVRPNPVGLHTVKVTAIDYQSGEITIDAIDVLDGTPIIDIKPYLPSVDAPFSDQET